MTGPEFISDGAKATQRGAILAALQLSPLSSLEARERLGIVHPAGRVMELRRMGHAIATKRRKVTDAQGRQHTAAVYVLEGVTHG